MGASLWGRQRPSAPRVAEEAEVSLPGHRHHQILSSPQQEQEASEAWSVLQGIPSGSPTQESRKQERDPVTGEEGRSPQCGNSWRGRGLHWGIQGTVWLQGSQPWLHTPSGIHEAG